MLGCAKGDGGKETLNRWGQKEGQKRSGGMVVDFSGAPAPLGGRDSFEGQ